MTPHEEARAYIDQVAAALEGKWPGSTYREQRESGELFGILRTRWTGAAAGQPIERPLGPGWARELADLDDLGLIEMRLEDRGGVSVEDTGIPSKTIHTKLIGRWETRA